jgi:hypothetical protein
MGRGLVLDLVAIKERDASALEKFDAVMTALGEDLKRESCNQFLRYDVARAVFESNSASDLDVYAMLFKSEFYDSVKKTLAFSDFEFVSFTISNVMVNSYANVKNHLPQANAILVDVIKELAGEGFPQLETAMIGWYRKGMERSWGREEGCERGWDVDFYKSLKNSKEESLGGFEYAYVFTDFCDEVIKKLQ